ncbi:MAG TPA: helix-turn-helix transcriptional regulator [Candidatus Dormibacteraeota bacterium]|nr:helix-turn-helix transcriptional regulator [Candidatus Dormibacteraeota bacterium]
MSEHQLPPPFKTLGSHLKYLREQQQESLAEVSGAVEIDETTLANIEAGLERPAEDILLLLVTYYDMQDQEAVQLWEMAGYDSYAATKFRIQEELPAVTKTVVAIVAMEARILYSDGLDIMLNQAGLTLNFTQETGYNQPPLPVARLGMSVTQAERVIKTLQQALLRAKFSQVPKNLPPSASQGPEHQ